MALKTGLNTSFFNKSSTATNSAGGGQISSVRVKKIILDDTSDSELFKRYGEWSSIGLILYEDASNPLPSDDPRYLENFAYPLFPNIKHYPLINELVYVIKLPSPDIQNNTNNLTTYYFPPINNWNSIHHNALPDPLSTSTETPSEQKSYQQVEAGSRVKTTNGVNDINLGETFNEQSNIRNLQPYEGDIIFEGRWGQSIRFGSTVTGSNNTWSSTGPNSKPITIIRNGQYNNNQEPWIPIVEDINQDSGSIYLTTTQQIGLNPSSQKYDSYSTQPTSINQYNNSQIIINSGRLVFNSSQDHILLSSKKSVGLNAVESINIDTPKTIVQSNKIYLGDKEDTNTQPLLLGQDTVDLLGQILDNLSTIVNDLSLLVGVPPGSPFGKLNADSSVAAINLKSAKIQLNTLLSKTSRTK